ncbi:MAG: formylglycine-generating enzyme family protein, partial [Pseudomonadota bacterium]|nr:formylglycine-generating enzyme family protein [Pseudomonadota bacterium]
MGRIRDLARGVIQRVGRIVEKDDLFEKPGERPATPPLPTKPAPEARAVPASASAVAKAPSAPVKTTPAPAEAPVAARA